MPSTLVAVRRSLCRSLPLRHSERGPSRPSARAAPIVFGPIVGLVVGLAVLIAVAGCARLGLDRASGDDPITPFTIAMIPDTQNYVDYTHQKAEGFALDASELFIAQMRWIAERSRARGGDIAFVAAVGDVWQHQSEPVDPAHAERGLGRIDNPFFGGHFAPTPKVHEVEIPKAVEGYRLISEAGLPFGVAPGNHDYDAMWSVEGYPPNLEKPRQELRFTPEDVGILHIGGLDNFRSVFGDDSPFFAGREWYVDSFRGGANSAQTFTAGGYTFLHIAIQMQADDAVLAWVESVLAAHPGLPTILTTHDYLNPRGERGPNPIVDLDRVDPDEHNSAEELWQKLIARQDQIFLVLCGHHHGQALRIEPNDSGHIVHQILADYQDRGQAGLDAGQPMNPSMRAPAAIGDGWLRLLELDLGGPEPMIRVRTYSTHYDTLSSELATYADWYREKEQPEMTDAEFHAAEEFTLPLTDFRERFGGPSLEPAYHLSDAAAASICACSKAGAKSSSSAGRSPTSGLSASCRQLETAACTSARTARARSASSAK